MRCLADLTLETLYVASQHAIRVLLIVAIAFVISRTIARSIPRLRARIVALMLRHGPGRDGELEKRAVTLSAIFQKTTVILVWMIAGVMVLKEAGFDIGPILAGAGVVGLAIGFGAQNLVRDIISGLFLLMENQIRVNDVVEINGKGGLVEEINLRTTVLRSLDGAVHVFPNGTIQTLSNLTHQYSYYVFDIGVAYKEDTDQVARVIREVADQMMREDEFRGLILEPLDVLGVDKFAESAVIIKARIKTLPIQQWTVGRELNRRFKKRFDELGIEMPVTSRTVQIAGSITPKPPQDSENLGA
jgi:small conductance mechanosensitive channel